MRSTLIPLLATTAAMAAPTPTGAKRMTMLVYLNIVSARASQNSMMGFFFSLMRLRAMAKMMVKTTTSSTSPREAASKKLSGNMLMTISLMVMCFA